MMNFGMQRYIVFLLFVFVMFTQVNCAISGEPFSVKLRTAYSQATFPEELINILDKRINGNDEVRGVFGKTRLTLPQKDPSCAFIPRTTRMYEMYCSGYPWLMTNLPYGYSPGNEIGSLILEGERANGNVNILFTVSGDKKELFIFHVDISKDNEMPSIFIVH